jgi:Electron transfer DM13
MIDRLLRAPLTWVAVAALLAVGAFGLYWFQPWKLVTDREVIETLSNPAIETPGGTNPTGTASGQTPGTPSAPAGPTLVSQGTFVAHEHDTSGVARIVRAADGAYRLELVGLDTSNGPDLRVWLTDQPVSEGGAGWRVFDDGRWVELGTLKGNRGDQAYLVPADVDPTQFRSVSIWCKRFGVSFGAAPLNPAG